MTARKRTIKPVATRPAPTAPAITPRGLFRCPLKTLEQVRAEASRLYRLARAGSVPADVAAKLTPLLQLIARLIEGGELERRVAKLEEGAT